VIREQVQRRLSRTERERRHARRQPDATSLPTIPRGEPVTDAEALLDIIDAALSDVA
jgi:hypothetical protein